MVKHRFFLIFLAFFLAWPLLKADQNPFKRGSFIGPNDLTFPAPTNDARGTRLGFAEDVHLPVEETRFRQIVQGTVELFRDDFRHHGWQIRAIADWEEPSVGAYAWINDALSQWRYIEVSGGLARHPSMTEDTLLTIVCHEIGHHLGGAPTHPRFALQLLSVEGQADYFATLKCLRRVFAGQDNQYFLENVAVPEVVREKCEQSFSDFEGQAICQRSALAGESAAAFHAELLQKDLGREPAMISFETPSTQVAEITGLSWPPPQCRLDTFFQGALCPVSEQIPMSRFDPVVGSCHSRAGDNVGLRPSCWYQPDPDLSQP